MFEFSEEQIARLLAGIYNGTLLPYNLPESLYFAIADYLKRGLYKGFGGGLSDFAVGSKDFELLSELRENVYMFSGAKTYQQVKVMSDFMSEGGRVPTVKEFDEHAMKVFDRYNKVWGHTEHQTCIGQGQCAVKWNKIVNDAAVLPLLQYSAVGGETTCPICGALDGMIRPVSDPIWRTKAPLNHFGCLCLLLQLHDGEVTNKADADRISTQVDREMQDIFKMNPGIDKVVFSDQHPYFSVQPKDRLLAMRNFDLPIPKKD